MHMSEKHRDKAEIKHRTTNLTTEKEDYLTTPVTMYKKIILNLITCRDVSTKKYGDKAGMKTQESDHTTDKKTTLLHVHTLNVQFVQCNVYVPDVE